MPVFRLPFRTRRINIPCPGSKLSPKPHPWPPGEAVCPVASQRVTQAGMARSVHNGGTFRGRNCTNAPHTLPCPLGRYPLWIETILLNGLGRGLRIWVPACNPSVLAWKTRWGPSARSVFLPGSRASSASSPGSLPPWASPRKSRASPAGLGRAPRGRRDSQTHICPSSSQPGRQSPGFQVQNGVEDACSKQEH